MKMAAGDLVITVTVKHKGEEIGANIQVMNDDILDLIREREFSLTHTIEGIGIKAVKEALKNYDTSKWGK